MAVSGAAAVMVKASPGDRTLALTALRRPGSLPALPVELVGDIVRLLDCAQPVGRLAATCRGLLKSLQRGSAAQPQLRVGTVTVAGLSVLSEALAKAYLPEVECLQVDVSRTSLRPSRAEVERALQELGRRLPTAATLETLTVRLASFDVAMERLRLGPETWEALICGLSGIAASGRLQRLELSNMTIKASRATQAVGLPRQGRALRRAASDPTSASGVAHLADDGCGDRSSGEEATAEAAGRGRSSQCREKEEDEPANRSFLEALGQLQSLQELRLTHDELFGSTATLLAQELRGLQHLKLVDLTRNHISKQVMDELRETFPKHLQLLGDDRQTFFFY